MKSAASMWWVILAFYFAQNQAIRGTTLPPPSPSPSPSSLSLELPENDPAWYYTSRVSGCPCYYEEENEGCACCKNGGCQCSQLTFPHRCGLCGQECEKLPSEPTCDIRSYDRCLTLHTASSLTFAEAQAACAAAGDSLPGTLAELSWETFWEPVNARLAHDSTSYWFDLALIGHVWQWGNGGSVLEYQGCFADVPADRDLPYHVISDVRMTPAKCLVHCQDTGYIFAGIQIIEGDLPNTYQPQCGCGNEFGKHGEVHGSGCASTCQQQQQEYGARCGDVNKQRIFYTYTQASTNMTNWSTVNEPEHCAAWSYTGWTKLNCTLKFRYLCQHDRDESTCTESGMFYTEKKCLSASLEQKAFYDALDSCSVNWPDTLAVLETGNMSKLHNDLSTRFGSRSLWINLSNRKWRWSDRSYWKEGQPVPNERGFCGLAVGEDGHKWSSANCSEKHAYVCEYKADAFLSSYSAATTTTTTTTTGTDEVSEETPMSTLPPGEGDNEADEKSKQTTIIAVVVCLMVVLIVAALLASWFLLKRRRKRTPGRSAPSSASVNRPPPPDTYEHPTNSLDEHKSCAELSTPLHQWVKSDISSDGEYAEIDENKLKEVKASAAGYLDMTGKENAAYLDMTGKEKAAYLDMTGNEKTACLDMTGKEKAAYLDMTGKEKAAYLDMTGKEKAAYLDMTGKEKAAYMDMTRKEKAQRTSDSEGYVQPSGSEEVATAETYEYVPLTSPRRQQHASPEDG